MLLSLRSIEAHLQEREAALTASADSTTGPLTAELRSAVTSQMCIICQDEYSDSGTYAHHVAEASPDGGVSVGGGSSQPAAAPGAGTTGADGGEVESPTTVSVIQLPCQVFITGGVCQLTRQHGRGRMTFMPTLPTGRTIFYWFSCRG